MDKKICFKCGVEKPLSEFYKHKQMLDGHVNKCKDCNKNDVHLNYEKNIVNPEYLEKERERGRSKYAKYKYKKNPELSYSNSNKPCAKFFKSKGFDLNGKEIHHWSYKIEYIYDVFFLNKRGHALIHKYIKFNKSFECFEVISDNKLLDSKIKMFEYIKYIFELNQVNYEIDGYSPI